MVEKFRAYAGYLARLRRDGCKEARLPAVLIVTASPLRERVIGQSLQAILDEAQAPTHTVFTSLDSLLERLGPWNRVWLPVGRSERAHWLLSEPETLIPPPSPPGCEG